MVVDVEGRACGEVVVVKGRRGGRWRRWLLAWRTAALATEACVFILSSVVLKPS